MSRIANCAENTARAFLFAAAILAAASPLAAQYVGHVDTNEDNNTPTLRATAVLEYTGDLTKPTASRLVPIAVWDGERYQPGGLYLAQPVPLTVESGTQYVLQVAGTPKGFYDVKAATDVGGSWIALGNYQKPTAPKPSHLKRSRTLPRVVSDIDDEKPHFAHVPAGDTNPGSGKSTSTGSPSRSQTNTTPVDPDRPTLHRRAADAGTPSPSTDSSASSNPAPNVDPDRPRLHRPTEASNSSASDGAPVTATDTIDPDRPHLEYGRPKDLEQLDAPAQIAKLAAQSENLEQVAAVSDAKTQPPHSFVYSWLDPEDEKKAQAALETVAEQLLAKSAQNVTGAVTHPAAAHRTTPRAASRKVSKAVLPVLTGEQLKAFELSYGSGATLVFTATSGQGEAARYITLIAQPDFNGTPIVLFKQIADERDLDVIPRMKFVDAVDTDGDNRAELIFALENKTGRQYAIYSVANNAVEQVFSTGG